MKKIAILLIIAIIGIFANLVYSFNMENSSFSSDDRISPFDRIKENQIKIYKDRIVIYIPNANLAKYADTNSMDPVLDKEATGIEIIPESEKDIKIGDIISYRSNWSDSLIVHRIIKIGEDEQGWYAYTKGDNSSVIDPGKIRFNQIKYVLIGVIY